MSFKEELFPSSVAFGALAGDQFETERVRTGGGQVYKTSRWTLPLRTFTIDTKVLTPTQAAAVRAFIKSVAFGSLYNFRFPDPGDYTSEATGQTPTLITALDVVIGTGNGSNKVFQLVKKYPSGSSTLTYTVLKPKANTVRIANAGSEVFSPGSWSVDTTTGIVTFVTAPVAGHSITAGFQYDIPAEFDADYVPATSGSKTWQFKSIGITEVRNP
jgi:uncharacterized protein (TIGR02217 family)